MRAEARIQEPAPGPYIDPERNPNHHIWNNNGTYFFHLTLVWNGEKKVRLRRSLRTKDLQEARRRRDRLIDYVRQSSELKLLAR